ncbi:MAG: PEP-CTERM sorting domain-containing protein [Desulfobacteraceae bacterium]
MKKIIILAVALFLVAATSGMAMAAFTYADMVVNMSPTADGTPNYAPSMNMNWLSDPEGGTPPDPDPILNPDRLLGPRDQYAVGWGPLGRDWTGAANAIVRMKTAFTHDGIVAGGPVEYDVTDEAVLSGMGYDLVIYGLGYGFDTPFTAHGQIKVYVAETLSSDINDWILVSSWSGNPNGTPGEDYFENRDGTIKDGVSFNNGGFGALAYTYMTIDLDNPKIVDPATGELMELDPITGEYNYIWFEAGYYEDDGLTHGNASFLDALGANPVPVPGAVWLLGSGLIGIIGIRRKKG